MSFVDVSRALAQPVRYRVLASFLARLGLVLILLRCVPLAVSWGYGETTFLMKQMAIIVAIGVVCVPLSKIDVQEDIRSNEVMVVSAFSFLLIALAGVLPFTDAGLSLADALFESVSAVTTTGLTTIGSIHTHSPGFLFDRAWMQWYGGLGIAVFSIGLMLLDKGVASRRLALHENIDMKQIMNSGRQHTRALIIVYCSLTLFAVIVLLLAGDDPFSAFTHALSGVSTGGFSIYDQSIGALKEWHVQLLMVLCGVAGAISFPFYFRLAKNGWKELVGNQELWGFLWVTVLNIVLLMGFSHLHGIEHWLDNARQTVILVLSAQTTTGFTITDVAKLDDASKLTLIFSMMIGGSTGSTSGGIKILRLLIVLRMLQLMIVRITLPAHAVLEPRLGDDFLENEDIEKAMLLVLIFIGTVGLSWLPFLAAGYAPLDALFEVVSACSTTGLSAGIVSAQLENGLKFVLIIDMLLGRVEFVAFLIFLYPRNWITFRSKT